MLEFRCVSPRILWIKFKFSKVKFCVMVECSASEGDGEERDIFRNYMGRILDGVGNGYRLCILDLNGWIEDKIRACINGAFEVPVENDSGRRVVEFCAERGLYVGNTYFMHMSLYEYIKVARGQDVVDIKR